MNCPKCNQPKAHFIPPSLGEEGFFLCQATATCGFCKESYTATDEHTCEKSVLANRLATLEAAVGRLPKVDIIETDIGPMCIVDNHLRPLQAIFEGNTDALADLLRLAQGMK